MRGRRRGASLCFIALSLLVLEAVPVPALAVSCTAALGQPVFAAGPLKIAAAEAVNTEAAMTPSHTWLLEVMEQGNDATVEVVDSRGVVVAYTDHPERRTGTRRLVLIPGASSITIRITGQDQSAGTATVRAFDLEVLRARPDCMAAYRALAAADADYAAGKQVSSGQVRSPAKSARTLYQQAENGYAAAERTLTDPEDQQLRAEVQLALAGVEYSGLQDWPKTVEWANLASRSFGTLDLYRRARADALLAAALVEIGNSAVSGRRVPGFDQSAPQLLARARSILAALRRFHEQRGERYDAALQLNNISLTYLYGGRYADCAWVSRTAADMFGSIHELRRQALASENRALCLWGLGRLPEALVSLEQALPVLSTEPVRILYLGVINNTALAHYALGHLDTALQLFDQSLALAQQGQWRRDEAQALFGIGITYYALGNRERALQFLERSRVQRVESGDGRGRMQTLRALATVYAEQGRPTEALSADKEALDFAVAPSAIERIQIQMAAHSTAAGHSAEALTRLDALLSTGGKGDAQIRAEALLQRGTVLRAMGRPREALKDLVAARPGLHRLGSVMEEFQADLELARDLRALGQPREALAAVDRALSRSDFVRKQSANPELRAQLQTPLRPAYDLKLDLLRAQYEDAVSTGRTAEAIRLATSAFLSADASRAQALADIGAHAYSPATRAAMAPELRRREALYNELAGRRFALDARLDSSGSTDPRAKHLMQDIAELERKVDTVNSVIASRTVAQNTRKARNLAGLPAIPDDSALIAYWIGSDFAYAWVLSSKGVQWVQLAAPATVAERAATLQRSLTRLVDMPVSRRLEDARALYDVILKPLERWLEGARNWIVVPDGPLDYVSFAALRGPHGQAESYLVEHHDLAVTPAAWLLRQRDFMAGASKEGYGILLVADPVYQPTDPRLTSAHRTADAQASHQSAIAPSHADLQRLPHTAHEARAIATLFPSGQVEQLTGLDATRARFLALDLSRYRYIHVATHGEVDAEVPQLSALVLGSYDASGVRVDGSVRVSDLAVQTLNADVITFSGCDTALGKQIPSEGLLGLGSTTLARGAHAVVASLWPVADEIGGRVMTDFYRHLLQEGASAPTALASAMRAAIARDRAADPALWAAFQVSVATLEGGRPIRDARMAPRTTSTRSEELP